MYTTGYDNLCPHPLIYLPYTAHPKFMSSLSLSLSLPPSPTLFFPPSPRPRTPISAPHMCTVQVNPLERGNLSMSTPSITDDCPFLGSYQLPKVPYKVVRRGKCKAAVVVLY